MSEATAKRHMGLRASRTVSNTLIHVLLIVISIIWLIPFVCIVLQSLTIPACFRRTFPGGIPTPLSPPWPPRRCRR